MTTDVSTDGSTAGPTDGSDGPANPAADASPVDVRDLPDIVLRPALEFAVGIAAAGQKLRPQLAYPSALKPLLKLNRLDRNSLRIARRGRRGR